MTHDNRPTATYWADFDAGISRAAQFRDRQVAAQALRRAAVYLDIDLPEDYDDSDYESGYQQARDDAEAWLHSRADQIVFGQVK